MNVGVDLGSSAVKVATDTGVLTLRGLVDPELSSRMGTTAPVVRHVGNALSLCLPHESYVLALSRVLSETPSVEDVTVVAPDWWSQRARDVLSRTLSTQYPDTAQLVGAAPAAVRAFSSIRPLAHPVVAVLDMGATCTSATVVVDDGISEPHTVGPSVVLQARGGDRIDSLLLHHVLTTLVAGGWSHDRSDPDVRRAARSFQATIRGAKEEFSTRPVVRLSASLPDVESELRLVRAEFDDVARPVIREIIGMLTTCIAGSEREVGAVLLVGGGAPTPMLTQMISVELGLPVLLDDEPASAAARGARLLGPDRSGRDRRSRVRIGARSGGRGNRRAEARPALAARIVSLPAPPPPHVVQQDEAVVASSAPTPAETPPAEAPPAEASVVPPAGGLADDASPSPEVPDAVLPAVAQFPTGRFWTPSNRHAAPVTDRPRPGEQVGGLGYRGRRRADPEPQNESKADDAESAEVETTSPPRPARHWSPR